MATEHWYAVYIVANATRLLYVGSELRVRMWKHKNKHFEGYTSNWKECRLVYYEVYDDVRTAINREKQLKCWRREKKFFLIEKVNKNWHDLSEEWFQEPKNNDNGVCPSTSPRRTRLRSG